MFAIIDVETTGLNAASERITEIAVYLYDGHQISWEAGAEVPNGIYFCTISTTDQKLTKKVMLSR